jgi:glycosyltransferase involved in cell wall biosynthesis
MKQHLFSVATMFLRLLPASWARKACQRNQKTRSIDVSVVRQMLVDVSMIYQSDAQTGIQRVVRAILLQLMQAPPRGYSICPVYATRQHSYRYANDDFLLPNSKAARHDGLQVSVQPGDIFLGLDLSAHLLPRHEAQLLAWKAKGVKLHTLVYDLLPLQNPQWFSPATFRNFKRWTRWLAVYADSAICISATVKNQLEALLGARYSLPSNALPVRTIVLGADIHTSQPSTGLPVDYQLLINQLRSTPAVLMVGTLEPRKGHDQVLAAFELLWQRPSPPTLVIAGKPGWKTEELQAKIRAHPKVGKQLVWLENASDEMLELLYSESWGVLVASHAEGFGLPVIEAAVFDKPVLARDLPVFREIDLPNISYFSADAPNTLAKAISDWMCQPKPLPPSEAQKKVYSWETAALQLVQGLNAQLQAHANTRVFDPVASQQGAN